MTLIVTKPEINHHPIRTEINELLYSFKLDAKRNEELERILKEREIYLEECYEFSYGVQSFSEEGPGYVSGTFNVVAEIVAAKERFAKRIRRCQIRQQRFKDMLDELPEKDAEVIAIALCTSVEVDERDVKRIMRKNLEIIRKYYPKD